MFKMFVSYYKKHLGLFIFDLFCALFVAVIDLVFPLVNKKALNEFIPNSNMKALYIAGIIMLGLFIIRFALHYCMGYYGHVLGIKMETSMRKDAFAKFESLDYEYYDNKKTGELLSNLSTHLSDISEMAHHAPEDILISVLMIIGSFIILFRINIYLTLICFVFIAILAIFAISRQRIRAVKFRKVRSEQGELLAKMENSLGGIHLTQAYNNEKYEIKKFDEVNENYKKARSGIFKEFGLFGGGVHFLTNLANLAVLVGGGVFVFEGFIDLTDLITYFLYINFLISPIQRLANSMETIQSGWSGVEKFYGVMTTESKIKEKANAVENHDFVGDIAFDSVCFKYGGSENNVLNNFDLKIKHGENIALVGETGVGKSTISKLIPRFYDISSGKLSIDGIDVKDYKIETLRGAIGHVQQDVFIFWGSIKENILYGRPDASDKEVVEAAKKADIHDFIMSLENGYDTMCGERGIRLSGGQKQRIAIARLFLRNPSIIILDEATSALDNVTEHQVQKAFESLSKGRTSIVIAHRLTTVRNADKIIVLGKDGIIEAGKHEELMAKKGVYEKMYNACLEV